LQSSVTTYESVLRGFERISLSPNETKTVEFKLKPEDLAIYDKDMNFVVEPGMFKVKIGNSSEDIKLTGDLEIK
jgi:beta-glucosidase